MNPTCFRIQEEDSREGTTKVIPKGKEESRTKKVLAFNSKTMEV